MKRGHWLQTASVVTTSFQTGVAFSAVSAGKYAISAFIDTNDSGEFPRDGFGRPTVPWAISGGGPAWLPPNWMIAATTITPGMNDVTLDFSHGHKQ